MLHRAKLLLVSSPLATIALGLTMTVALAQTGETRCGDETQVRAGDTLSGLAERCGITEARILDLNPKIEGSKDLRPGMTLNLAVPSTEEVATWGREASQSLLGRLKSYATEAGRRIEGAVENVSQSIEDFIEQNPDLHHRIRKLGERLNIPSLRKVEAQVSLSVRRGAPGTPVTLSAIGLPPNQRVEIAGGAPDDEYRIIETARTSAKGTLQVTVELPTWADSQRDFIFVIASPKIDVAVRSAAFDVEDTSGTR